MLLENRIYSPTEIGGMGSTVKGITLEIYRRYVVCKEIVVNQKYPKATETENLSLVGNVSLERRLGGDRIGLGELGQ